MVDLASLAGNRFVFLRSVQGENGTFFNLISRKELFRLLLLLQAFFVPI
jgi:hypothetical protein